MLNYDREFLVFVGARLAGVVIRPLLLFLMLQLNQDELAANYALVISAAASSFLIFNNQNFRTLYEYFLSPTKNRGLGGKQRFVKYIDEVVIHIFVFFALALLLIWIWVADYYLLIIVLLICFSERYFDDDQRILIYSKKYYQWSINFIFRTIIPGLFLLVMVFLEISNALYFYTAAVGASLLSYLLIFRRKFVSILLRWVNVKIRTRRVAIKPAIKQYYLDYRNEYFATQLIGRAHV